MLLIIIAFVIVGIYVPAVKVGMEILKFWGELFMEK